MMSVVILTIKTAAIIMVCVLPAGFRSGAAGFSLFSARIQSKVQSTEHRICAANISATGISIGRF